MKYEDVLPISRSEAEASLVSPTSDKVRDALLRAALHLPDIEWVQDQCLKQLKHSDLEVRRIAVLCFGHLARLHKHIDPHRVVPALKSFLHDPELGGTVEDVLDDIEVFVGSKMK